MIRVDENDPIGELEPTFPYRDVAIKRGVDVKEFYDLEGEIGRGKFGTVYKCREKGTNLSLAAKFVGIARRQDRKNVEREVEIMRTLQHPRLIQLYDAFETDNVMCVVLELIEGGELFERVIDDDFILTEKACTVFMRQICEGVAFIHSHNIIHLDLKPENILCLTKTGNRIKIIDFGLARKFEPDKKLQVLFGTPEFVAPEVVNFDQISCATDMWSVGVICYVLLSGLSPFMGETDVETMANVTIARYDFDDDSFHDITSEAKDFISKLLVKDKQARLTAVECLSHPWLRRQIPPPPPALDTTKDNLRNYLENNVPFIQNPLIIEKDFHNKPGLIEKIIENEQKVIHSRSLPINEKKEMPIIPPLNDNQPDHNLLKTDKSRIKIPNHPCLKEVETLSNMLDNNKTQTAEIIEENNMKNNSIISKISSNSLLPSHQNIFGITRDLNSINPQNAIKMAVKGSASDTEDKGMAFNVRPMGILSSCRSFNENTEKKDSMFNLNMKTINTVSENNLLNLQENTKDKKIRESHLTKMEHAQEKIITSHSSVSSEAYQHSTKIDKLVSEKPPIIVVKDKKRELFSSNIHQIKRPQEANQPMAQNKASNIPTIVVPSISTSFVPNASSDFTLLTFNSEETSTRKTEKSYATDFIKSTGNKNVSNEQMSFGDSVLKEVPPTKENDPTIFKQHLRSTPPWFSELKNQHLNKPPTDRFDRRSSDFSCFLNSKEDSESLNLADEIRKLSARLLQMSTNQTISPNQHLGNYNANSVSSRSRNDPITCFLENHGIPHPRPKFKFSNLNRDVPIGSPPPPSNLAYYLNMASNTDRKDSHSAPESPRSSPVKNCESTIKSTSCSRKTDDLCIKKENSLHSSQEKTSLECVQVNKSNNKLNLPV